MTSSRPDLKGRVTISLAQRPHAETGLKNPAYRKIHSALSGQADAAKDRDWADDGIADHSHVRATAHDQRIGIVKRRPRFIPSAPIDFLSHDGGRR